MEICECDGNHANFFGIPKYLEVLHASVIDKLFSNLSGGCRIKEEIHQHQEKHLGDYWQLIKAQLEEKR